MTRRTFRRPPAESARRNRTRRASRQELEPPPQRSGSRAPHRGNGCGGTASMRSARVAPHAAAPREQRNSDRPEGPYGFVGSRTQRACATTDHGEHCAESVSRHRRGAAAERHTTASEATELRPREPHEKRRVQQRRDSSATATASMNPTTPTATARRERAPQPATTHTARSARAATEEEPRTSAKPPHRMQRNGERDGRTSGAACNSAARAARRRPHGWMPRPRRRPHVESAHRNRPRRTPHGELEPPPQKSRRRVPHRRIGYGGTTGGRNARAAPRAAPTRELRDGDRPE